MCLSFNPQKLNVHLADTINKNEDAVKITLQFDGEVDFTGYGDIGAQNVTLTQVTKADVCHSNDEEHVFKYVRTR